MVAELKGMEDRRDQWRTALKSQHTTVTARPDGSSGSKANTTLSKVFSSELVVRMLSALLDFGDFFIKPTRLFDPPTIAPMFDKTMGVSLHFVIDFSLNVLFIFQLLALILLDVHTITGAMGSMVPFTTVAEARRIAAAYDAARLEQVKNGTEIPAVVDHENDGLVTAMISACAAPNFTLFDTTILEGMDALARKYFATGTHMYSRGSRAHRLIVQYGKELRLLFMTHYKHDLQNDTERGKHVQLLLARLEFYYFHSSDEVLGDNPSSWPLLCVHVLDEMQNELRLYASGFAFVSVFFHCIGGSNLA